MNLGKIATALLIALTVSAARAEITVTNFDGGSVVTDLGLGVKVNEGSSLHRNCIVLNDPACPMQLNSLGIVASYSEHYSFDSIGSATPSKSCQAYEVRYILYDVFGQHMETLSNLRVSDYEDGKKLAIPGSWYASESDVSELLTIVSFVSNVRLSDGKVWHCDPKAIAEQLEKIKIKSADVLEPTKELKK